MPVSHFDRGEWGNSVSAWMSQREAGRKGAPSLIAMAAAIAAACCVVSLPAEAHRHAARHAVPAWSPVSEMILLDAETGRVLTEANADAITYPASLTKMMTLYLTFEALNAGKLHLGQRLVVSPEAARQKPSKLGLQPGETISVHDLVLAIVTKSANDAAVVLAEGLAGSVPSFAEEMNHKAHQLGMTHTFYHNPNGLPDPQQRTTARDIARLALALYHDFPREYRYFSTREFEFHGRKIATHNHLLEWYEGADGIKTGFINASGFNLAASAVRNGHRLIGVIMGGRTAHSRDEEMADLFDQGFAHLGAATAVAQRETPPAATAAAAETPRHTPGAAAVTAPATRAAAAERKPPPTPFVAGVELAAEKSGLLRKALQHLSPVGKAEAAAVHEAAAAAPAIVRHWAIQVGAFRAEAAAKRAGHKVARLPIARGKVLQILQPQRGDRERLYRARLLNFTPRTAQRACAVLHKRRIDCAVVRAGGVKVAYR
jgi:D-alanyl-D-alanine carboxypeptidase